MKFRFSGMLLRFTEYRREIEVDAPTVASGLEQLSLEFPSLTAVLFDSDGGVRAVHRLFLRGEQLDKGGLAIEVGSEDTVHILTMIAGG
jgi:molybdopterin synthase sulfur carrier subunit